MYHYIESWLNSLKQRYPITFTPQRLYASRCIEHTDRPIQYTTLIIGVRHKTHSDADDFYFLCPILGIAIVSSFAEGFAGEDELKRKLLLLKNPLSIGVEVKSFIQRWEENGDNWTQQFRAIMIECRNIGHDWQFTESQNELWKKYYEANNFLVKCLNSDCRVSPDVRQQIEDTMILPISSIPTYWKTV